MVMIPVLLSGGSGTRLWPLSREEYPKHLIPLMDQQTLLQKTLLRLQGLPVSAPIVVGNASQRFMVAQQIQQLGVKPEAIILEPVGRNTAPAVAVAALQAQRHQVDALLLVLPADHMIRDVAAFQQAVNQGMTLAQTGKLITFGIVPQDPDTGYGYIQQGDKVGANAYQVSAFKEKPDLATAKHYLASGQYYWNSGMFLMRADCYLSELKALAPEVLSACEQALAQAQADLDFMRLDTQAFSHSPDISIDYAVMEHTGHAVMIPLDARWSDVGTWGALAQASDANAQGNVIQGDVITDHVTNSYLRAESRLLAVIGLDNHVVIETSDAVLVAPKDSAAQVKSLVEQLTHAGRSERLHHTRQFRPWGYHELLIERQGFQVRRVVIKPGQAIALQRHQMRTEHWVVVKGQAQVQLDTECLSLSENQSCYVPLAVAHKISNTGNDLLEFIEIQVGACIKDDDIERIEGGHSGG
jgi:mannose-1-phosphate guanylyltransferase/mannose-6-phosphate isomerase